MSAANNFWIQFCGSYPQYCRGRFYVRDWATAGPVLGRPAIAIKSRSVILIPAAVRVAPTVTTPALGIKTGGTTVKLTPISIKVAPLTNSPKLSQAPAPRSFALKAAVTSPATTTTGIPTLTKR